MEVLKQRVSRACRKKKRKTAKELTIERQEADR